jgi:pimeloyl-ACP methyl ester carboxylesterase
MVLLLAIMPDYRGYGKSSGRIASEQMLHDDATVAYQYLLGRYPEDQIVVYGRSIGSGIAAYLAKTHRPRMLILETLYFSLKEMSGNTTLLYRAHCSNILYAPTCGSAMSHAQSICSMAQATISFPTAQASGLPRWSEPSAS